MVSSPSPRLSGHPPQANSASKSTPLLSVEQVERLYDGSNGGAPTRALASTTFQVSAGEFICIVGPSGCGKSTLLRILGGLLQPTRGHVYLQGQELTEPRSEIGYVFQHANLAMGLDMVSPSSCVAATCAHEGRCYLLTPRAAVMTLGMSLAR